MVIKKHITIGAPPELIWDVITDLRKAKEWAPGFEDYPHISAEWPGAGATAVWRYHAGPTHFDFNLLLTKAERGRFLEIANTSAFGAGLEIYRFEHNGGKTTIEYEASSRPNLLGRLFAAAMTRKLEKQMDQTVANLKRYCEARLR
jgi:carbon monoxide dehydrogenase subunit G